MAEDPNRNSLQRELEATPDLGAFEKPTYEQWKETAVKALKGAPFEKKLLTKTLEGITLDPIYNETDLQGVAHLGTLPGHPPYVRGSKPISQVSTPWEIVQETRSADAEEANKVILEELERGAQGFELERKVVSSEADLSTALEGVDLQERSLRIEAGESSSAVLANLRGVLKKKGADLKQLTGCVGADPVGELARTGELGKEVEKLFKEMAADVNWAGEKAPGLRTVLCRGRLFAEAGADAATELGLALATGVEYLRGLINEGVDPSVAARSIEMSLSAGSFFFMEIAKLRAARMLWSKVVEEFHGDEGSRALRIHVRTSARNQTLTDPWVNMLRTTTEVFSAAVGGADSVHAGRYDELAREPDEFSRRVARNCQIVLQEESGLGRVVDPAGGSWYVENLTDKLARKAWRLLREIEGKGGMIASLCEGYPQTLIDEIAAKEISQLSTRKSVLIGTNIYPNANEEPLSPVPREELSGSSSCAAVRATPLKMGRPAEIFEALRYRANRHFEKHGKPPEVFLANMGPIPQHKPRADFSTGFFQVGGFKVLGNDGFDTPEKAADAAVKSGAKVAVICSTDPTYPQMVPAFMKRLKELDGEMHAVLAGFPKDQLEAHREAGVGEFIHLRADVHGILESLMDKIGVER